MLRIAWFKAHHTDAFYKAIFGVWNWYEDIDFLSLDIVETQRQLNRIKARCDDLTYEDYDESMLQLLKMRLEMLEGNK